MQRGPEVTGLTISNGTMQTFPHQLKCHSLTFYAP